MLFLLTPNGGGLRTSCSVGLGCSDELRGRPFVLIKSQSLNGKLIVPFAVM